MKTFLDRAGWLIGLITYKDNYELSLMSNGRELFVFVEWNSPEEGYQRGRYWLLEEDMTDSEIVGTALKAVLTFEEHEAREAFRYRGARVFGPHLDLDDLVDFAKKKENLSLRT